jgi:hypothetical protein
MCALCRRSHKFVQEIAPEAFHPFKAEHLKNMRYSLKPASKLNECRIIQNKPLPFSFVIQRFKTICKVNWGRGKPHNRFGSLPNRVNR